MTEYTVPLWLATPVVVLVAVLVGLVIDHLAARRRSRAAADAMSLPETWRVISGNETSTGKPKDTRTYVDTFRRCPDRSPKDFQGRRTDRA
jgi:hypothetical protein